MGLKRRIADLRNDELRRLGKIVIGFVAIPIVLQSILTDVKLYGWHESWVWLRLGIVPIGLLAISSYRLRFIQTHAGLPLILTSLYIAGIHLFFVSQTGYAASLYFHGYIQLLLGLAILPLSFAAFASTSLLVIALFLLIVLYGSNFNWPVLAEANLVFLKTYVILSFLSFYIINRVRTALYEKTLQQEDEIHQRQELIMKQVDELTSTRLLLEAQTMEAAHNRRMAEFAAQVSHDIRSPLSALNLVINTLTQIDSDRHTLMRQAVRRISEIAAALMNQSKVAHNAPQSPTSTSASSVTVTATADSSTSASVSAKPLHDDIDLLDLIEDVLMEKRIQIQSMMNVEIELKVDTTLPPTARICPVEMSRVISNVLDNAIQAASTAKPGSGKSEQTESGKVSVEVRCISDSDDVVLEVSDTGMGIPPHILPHLGKRGVTHGKADGSGLGLYHAKTTLNEYSGSLEIQSSLGSGTKVTMRLPRSSDNGLAVSELPYEDGLVLVTVDDEPHIHALWKDKLKDAERAGMKIEHVVLHSPSELWRWLQASDTSGKPHLFAVDHDFKNQPETGLDLINKLGLDRKTILVTARETDVEFQNRVKQAGTRLLPKRRIGRTTWRRKLN